MKPKRPRIAHIPEIVGVVGPGEGEPAEPAPITPPPSPAYSNSGSDHGPPGEPEPAGVGPGDGVPGPDHPKFIDGAKVSVDNSGDKDGLRIYCTHHPGSTKYRSLHLDPYGHGPRACHFYLGAWLAAGAGVTIEDHRKPPTRAQVEAYAAAHPDE